MFFPLFFTCAYSSFNLCIDTINSSESKEGCDWNFTSGFDFEYIIQNQTDVEISIYNNLDKIVKLNIWKLVDTTNITLVGKTSDAFLYLCSKNSKNDNKNINIKMLNLNVSFIDYSEGSDHKTFDTITLNHSRILNIPNTFLARKIDIDLYSLNGTYSFAGDEISINFVLEKNQSYEFGLSPSQTQQIRLNLNIDNYTFANKYEVISNNTGIDFSFGTCFVFIQLLNYNENSNTIHFNIYDKNKDNIICFNTSSDFSDAIYDIHFIHEYTGKIHMNSNNINLLSHLHFNNISVFNDGNGEILFDTELNPLDKINNEIYLSNVKLIQNKLPENPLKIYDTLNIVDIYDVSENSTVNALNLKFDSKYPQIIIDLDNINGSSSIIIDEDLYSTNANSIELKPITSNYSFINHSIGIDDTVFSICAKNMNAKIELVSSDEQKFLFSKPEMAFIKTTTNVNGLTCENVIFTNSPDDFIYNCIDNYSFNYSKINENPNLSIIVIHNPISLNFSAFNSSDIPYKIYYSLSEPATVDIIDSKENVELYFYNTNINFSSPNPKFNIISLQSNSRIITDNVNLSNVKSFKFNINCSSETYGCKNISVFAGNNELVNFTENKLLFENNKSLVFESNTSIYYYFLDTKNINFKSKIPDDIQFFLVFKETEHIYKMETTNNKKYNIDFSELNKNSFINATDTNFKVVYGNTPSIATFIPISNGGDNYILPIDLYSIPNNYKVNYTNYYGICSKVKEKLFVKKKTVQIPKGFSIKNKIKTIFSIQDCDDEIIVPVVSIPFINMSSDSIIFAKNKFNYLFQNDLELLEIDKVSVDNYSESSLISTKIKDQIYIGPGSKLNLYLSNLGNDIKIIFNCTTNDKPLIRYFKDIYSRDFSYLSKYKGKMDPSYYQDVRFPDLCKIEIIANETDHPKGDIMEFSYKSDCLIVKKNVDNEFSPYSFECIESGGAEKTTKLTFRIEEKGDKKNELLIIILIIFFLFIIAIIFVFIVSRVRNHKKWLTSTIITDTLLEPPEDL